MRYKATFYLLGRLLLLISGFLILPAGVSFYYGEQWAGNSFLLTASFSLTLSLIFHLRFRKYRREELRIRDGFLLVSATWFLVSLIGAIPYYMSPYFLNFVDAFFESVSGFTTTGATILSDIENLSRGVLFWRSLTQWIGGMGIIVLAVAILPQLSVGGMQIMKNETPGPTFEQLKPRIRQTAISLWKIYLLFSLLQVLALHACGLNLFESFCHMFTTMSTGGFSIYNGSMAVYSPLVQMIIALFMYIAGMNFVLHYANLRGDFKKPFTDSEWRFYTGLLIAAIVLVTFNLAFQTQYDFLTSLRLAIFQVLTITSTTGYVTDNFDAWPHLSKGLLFLLMFVGGCAGSTAGGLKQVRLLLLFKRARQSIIQHIFPKAVISIKLSRRAIPENILYGVSSFFLIFMVILSFGVMALLAFNYDFITSASAVLACLSNIGPGLAEVGAVKNYAFFQEPIKLLLCAFMIIGRLEIFTVLVLFVPATWRR